MWKCSRQAAENREARTRAIAERTALAASITALSPSVMIRRQMHIVLAAFAVSRAADADAATEAVHSLIKCLSHACTRAVHCIRRFLVSCFIQRSGSCEYFEEAVFLRPQAKLAARCCSGDRPRVFFARSCIALRTFFAAFISSSNSTTYTRSAASRFSACAGASPGAPCSNIYSVAAPSIPQYTHSSSPLHLVRR
jgi:hypothetical protein